MSDTITLDRLLNTVESLRTEFRGDLTRMETAIKADIGKVENSVDSIRKDFATMEAGRLSKLEGTVTRLELLLNGVVQNSKDSKNTSWKTTSVTIMVSVVITFLVTYFLNDIRN